MEMQVLSAHASAVAGLLAGLAADAAGTPASELVIPRLPSAAPVDSAADQSPRRWPSVSLSLLGTAPKGMAAPTAAAFAADLDGLNVRVDCGADGFSEAAETGPDVRDGRIWGEPSVEVFLWPSAGSDDYVQVIVNSRGALLDSRVTDTAMGQRATAWNGEGITRHISVSDRGWQVALHIPYAALGLRSVRRGTGLRARVVRNVPDAGMILRWPKGTATSHSALQEFGTIILEDRNLLANPGFETPERGWVFPNQKRNGVPAGTVAYSRDAAYKGELGLRYARTAEDGWYPQVFAKTLEGPHGRVLCQPNSRYRFSAWVRGTGTAYFRWNTSKGKMGEVFPLEEDWRQFVAEFSVPNLPGPFTEIGVGVQTNRPGHMDVDTVSLERLHGRTEVETLPKAHPLHGLTGLARQRHFPPYPLLAPENILDCQPLFVNDTASGNLLVRVVRGGRHRYSDISPWNANGTLFALNRRWRGEKSLWLLDTGTGLARRVPAYSSMWTWDRNDPDTLYLGRTNEVCTHRPSTRALAKLVALDGIRAVVNPQSWDGKMLAVFLHHRKGEGLASTFYWLTNDGDVAARFTFPGQIHNAWFTKDSDYAVMFSYEDHKRLGADAHYVTMDGTLSRVRVFLDGRPLGTQSVPYSVIGKGHGGGKPGYWVWVRLLNSEWHDARGPGVDLAAGEHRLVFDQVEAPFAAESMVVTNDLAWVPDGIWNWLPPETCR